METDDIVERHANNGVQVTIKVVEDFVLIEGTREALDFLSELLSAQAKSGDRGFQISPTGAGNALFSSESTHGIYVHRIDD